MYKRSENVSVKWLSFWLNKCPHFLYFVLSTPGQNDGITSLGGCSFNCLIRSKKSRSQIWHKIKVISNGKFLTLRYTKTDKKKSHSEVSKSVRPKQRERKKYGITWFWSEEKNMRSWKKQKIATGGVPWASSLIPPPFPNQIACFSYFDHFVSMPLKWHYRKSVPVRLSVWMSFMCHIPQSYDVSLSSLRCAALVIERREYRRTGRWP